ncbi:hypothetical protein ACH518_19210 [Methylomonas sp. HW2-6]|uniref:hypothetical protein n=1 Tax=Methylomonas sp. HW2-6 TaxID=3376687 RepID=UPI00404360EC
MQASATLLNIALYFLIANRDIQAVKIDALTHPDAWKRSLCARVILLTIHELDMDKVAGIKLREALTDSGVSEESKRLATQALRSVRAVQQKAQKQFAFHRNATIAHRDPDALLQYRAITELDVMVTLQIASEFFEGSQLFISALPDLMLSVGSMPGILRQFAAQAKRKKSAS